jgi:hypothetical protein
MAITRAITPRCRQIEALRTAVTRERKKTAARPTIKRGPTPRIQQQLEAVSALPRAKQRAVMQVLDAVLQQQASR